MLSLNGYLPLIPSNPWFTHVMSILVALTPRLYSNWPMNGPDRALTTTATVNTRFSCLSCAIHVWTYSSDESPGGVVLTGSLVLPVEHNPEYTPSSFRMTTNKAQPKVNPPNSRFSPRDQIVNMYFRAPIGL